MMISFMYAMGYTQRLVNQLLRCSTVVCILLVLVQDVDSLASSSSLAPREPINQRQPFVGYAKRPKVTFTVIGTSHFQCNSAVEIKSLIEQLKPDGVVVELDPERVIRLTKEAAASTTPQWFGADFLAAIDTARDMDIPLFIGDEYTKETKARFMETALSPATYSPRGLLSSMFRSNGQINLVETFLQDPMKLAPLAATLSLPFLLLIIVSVFQGNVLYNEMGSLRSNTEILLSVVVSFLATCKVYNTLIADRDAVLVAKATNAAGVILSLKRKETIRKRWTFPVEQNTNRPLEEPKRQGIPLFTLKRPLEEDATRSLYLFEPRWLSMIDNLGFTDGGDPPQFGSLTCVNKFYSATVDLDGTESKYADVIFKRTGRMASLADLIEGNRPSGDRKVTASIDGKEAFTVNEDDIFVAEEGYLMTSNVNEEEDTFVCTNPDNDDAINIVVVVGLLHANGVIDRLGSSL